MNYSSNVEIEIIGDEFCKLLLLRKIEYSVFILHQIFRDDVRNKSVGTALALYVIYARCIVYARSLNYYLYDDAQTDK